MADRYRLLFGQKGLLDVVTPPAEQAGTRHIFHQYVVRARRRDELQAFLGERGITTRVYYPLSLHLQPCFRFLGYQEGAFPVSEVLSRETLALPMFPELEVAEQERVVEEIGRFYGRG